MQVSVYPSLSYVSVPSLMMQIFLVENQVEIEWAMRKRGKQLDVLLELLIELLGWILRLLRLPHRPHFPHLSRR